MKKIILLLVIITSFCSQSMQAQKTKPHPCDSIQAMFDEALGRLDSLVGSQNEFQRQLDSLLLDISRSRTEINNMLKEKNETATALKDARKLIAGQMDLIKELEAEVKRLSAAKSGKKGT